MANRHFAEIGDVWKHLVLCETLELEGPRQFWESHAGSAWYELTPSPARDYGALHLMDRAKADPVLDSSAFMRRLRSLRARRWNVYPGSPLFAMAALGDGEATFLLCDTDAKSLATISDCARERCLDANTTRVMHGDGITALAQAARSIDAQAATDVLAHIDPYDHFESGERGLNSVDLFRQLAVRGMKVLLWYGYDSGETRRTVRHGIAQALRSLAVDCAKQVLWHGEIVLASIDDPDLDLDPGVMGCAVLGVHLSPQTVSALDRLGEAFEGAYRGVVLPGGKSGDLVYTSGTGDASPL
jgi:23S rRNA (adenine2030-N6)-methyltransferase